jgi:hypothetical protein
MTEACELLALDVVGQIAFGHSFNLQSEKTYLSFHRAIKLQSYMFNVFMQQPALKRILSPCLAFATNLGYRDPFLDTLDKIIQARRTDEMDGKHDFYSVAADKINPSDMISEVGLLLLAGLSMLF